MKTKKTVFVLAYLGVLALLAAAIHNIIKSNETQPPPPPVKREPSQEEIKREALRNAARQMITELCQGRGKMAVTVVQLRNGGMSMSRLAAAYPQIGGGRQMSDAQIDIMAYVYGRGLTDENQAYKEVYDQCVSTETAKVQ